MSRYEQATYEQARDTNRQISLGYPTKTGILKKVRLV
jgi:hypothetical protein